MAETTRTRIPFIYRAVFLWFEPLAALAGVLVLYLSPALFLNSMSPKSTHTPDTQVVYHQLAASYTLFAFNELVLLRITSDLRVWRTLFIGILICDALHLHGSWVALGSAFWHLREWRWEDWVNLGSLWAQAALRVAFLAGVGLDGDAHVKSD
ncbi:hypothetical protein F66182_4405 [Fusarium sp. NRRL 66182]|nr:hypothetical protein F66182_4405 [Fusarium sp. NRRL 66182]